MGLFGPSKIKINPRDFLQSQIDELFSESFVSKQNDEFIRLSNKIPLLKTSNKDNYLVEMQNAKYNLLQMAFDRNASLNVFKELTINRLIDPRIQIINTGSYDMCLSRAKDAGMTTFSYYALIFLAQLVSKEVDVNSVDFKVLHEIYTELFTNIFHSYESLIKNYKFII